jgi:Phosphoenolpyruvate synthase/pyruvate phosphate dikinase
MLNFDRASTGIKGLDKILDDLRWGDNVVWQVEGINEYQNIVLPFVKQALNNQYPVVYMRFGQHAPLLQSDPRIKMYELDPNLGFETFSSQVHAIAGKEGEGVCYVFDSLSDLLSAWANDLMIGNFFRVTCPYLFELNTIAYFTLLKNRNSFATIARIRDTTQLLLDLYSFENRLYIHPLKVWNRYSPTMFLPHISQGNDFVPITNSVETTQFFSRFQQQGPGKVELKLDHWDKVFLNAQEIWEDLNQGLLRDPNEEHVMTDQLCKMMIGRDEKILALARRYLTLSDLLEIHNRLVGSGFIGGKAVGMLIARKILQINPEAGYSCCLEPHDSFYVGSDVYYTYLVENGCWELRQKQKQPDNYFSAAAHLKEKILNGTLPESISEQLKQMLDFYGQSPIIVRSSSLLEDSFGNAFAGKYKSVFCVNQGNPQDRYHNFENAVKSIYASTMSEDALAYRLQRGMAESDEQMALLVQRVSGSYRSRYFFPDLAGVAMSHNPYVWREDLDANAGMVRLVLGLGTRAVDRVEDDYPRVIALDKPTLRPDSNLDDIRRFSQRRVDVLDITQNQWATVSLASIARQKEDLTWWSQMAVPDYETMHKLKQMNLNEQESWILTFDEFLTGPFPTLMRQILHELEQAYAYPVDTEFTVNFGLDGSMQINLLQCRPLQIGASSGKAVNLDFDPANLLFSTFGNSMGGNIQQKLEAIVYVQPEAYAALTINDKYQVARLIGRLNRLYKDRSRHPFILMGPGRWGSSTPSLGVPVSFAEICNAAALVEIAETKEGYMPELSFGTHFFQDLVETRIFYTALFPGQEKAVFHNSRLEEARNQFADILPEYAKWQSVIKVIHPADAGLGLWLESSMETSQTVCFFTTPDQEER